MAWVPMGAGASSAVLVRRDVKCPHRSFDGVADIAETGGKCTCRACVRERQQASSPLMDTHDAYTLTTAMRVIERSHGKVMPPRSAPCPAMSDPGADSGVDETESDTAAAAAATASTVLRRRAGLEPDNASADSLDATPMGKENASHEHRRRNDELNSPVFDDSPLKPAIEAYSAAVLRSATVDLAPKQATPACGRRARTPLKICRPDFTANSGGDC